MRINFHGATQTVTGSQFLLEVNGARLLLECGLFQGRRRDTYERNHNFAYNPRDLDAVILSHAHIDHSGNLPNLVKKGYSGPIYATQATINLADVMLRDSGHIHESDIDFVNKHRARRGDPPVEPLYTQADAAEVARYFQAVDYDQPFEPVPGVTARLVEAGHILGSAAVSLVIEEKGRKIHLWFSGDIGRRDLPLLRDPVLPENVDYLIMESTYGDKPHEDIHTAYEEFRSVVAKTVERGGKVVIPAFSVGRTQELVFCLNEMIYNRDLPAVRVFVDSPLAINVSEIFRKHPECFDAETREFIRTSQHPALDFDLLSYTRSVEESKAINDYKEPAVIISASGMAETGRILHHLRATIENPANTIMIVSWQAPYTLGRRLAECKSHVKIFGMTYERRAEVATIGGLSAHAGQTFLLEYALNVKKDVKDIYLVHGEEVAASILRERMQEMGLTRVHYPNLHTAIDI